MSLGKRPRAPSSAMMKRTASLADLTPGLVGSDPTPDPNPRERQRPALEEDLARPAEDLMAAVEAAEFLRACGICKRNLGPGRDTFIYRGDAAFCSLECCEKQMKIDALKEKCSQMLRKSNAPPPPKARPEAPGSSKTVVAA